MAYVNKALLKAYYYLLLIKLTFHGMWQVTLCLNHNFCEVQLFHFQKEISKHCTLNRFYLEMQPFL